MTRRPFLPLLLLLAAALCLAADAPSVELDPGKQKFIWDAEHVTFKIETYVGKPLCKALIAGDAEAAGRLFREDFRGAVRQAAAAPPRRVSSVTERRTEGKLRPADTSKVVAELLALFRPIDTVQRSAFKVLQIDRLSGDDETPQRWTTRLRLTAAGEDDAGRPVEFTHYLDGEFAFDTLEAFDTGRVIAALTPDSLTRRESQGWLMQDVTASSGISALGLIDNWDLPIPQRKSRRYQPAVADFDNDGWLDIVIGSTDGKPRLLRSIDGTNYEDVAAAMGLKPADSEARRWAINALVAWIDFDNDGWQDLLLAERLYRNDRGRRFVDVSATSGLRFDRIPLGVAVLDYDADGRLDLYISYQKGFRATQRNSARPWVDDSEAGAGNHLWRNEGHGRFKDVTATARASGGKHQTFATTVFFVDGDHLPDLYNANDFGRNVLLRNRGDGTFEDITEASRTGDFATSMGVTSGDLDNDGQSELYVANMFSKMGRRIIAHVSADDYPPGIYDQIVGSCAGNRLYRRSEDGYRFEETSEQVDVNQVGWAYAPAMVDLDGDGWLDLYSTTGYQSFDRGMPDG